jgi:hypothetical protein
LRGFLSRQIRFDRKYDIGFGDYGTMPLLSLLR